MSTKPLKTSLWGRSQTLLGMAARVARHEVAQRIREQVTSSAERIAKSELATRIAQARVIANRLSELKGAAMKAGQLLSIDGGDLLPPEALEILAKLQGQAEPVDFEVIERVLQADLSDAARARLEDLEPEAAAAASIGQVHRARVDGRLVAVKVQYPGIAESIDSDMAVLESVAGVFLTVARSRIELAGMFDELRKVLHQEADYQRERASLEAYGALLASDTRFVVPQPYPELCGRRVLTMTWEPGLPLRQWLAGDPPLAEREWLARAVLDLYCREFFEWGFVQTDPNHGNFLLRPEERQLVLLDLGAALTYEADFRERYTALLRAIPTRDARLITRRAVELGLLDPREPPVVGELFAEMLALAMEPFLPERQPFVFRDADYAERARAAGRRFTKALVYSPPPRALIFLHRKLGGIFQLLKRLDLRLDLVPYWEQMVLERGGGESAVRPTDGGAAGSWGSAPSAP